MNGGGDNGQAGEAAKYLPVKRMNLMGTGQFCSTDNNQLMQFIPSLIYFLKKHD
jgi:hypothetical protein